MKIGCIGYSNNTGLGNYITNLRKHLPLDSQLVIRHPDKGWRKPTCSYIVGNNIPTTSQLIEYLEAFKPDVIIIIETAFNNEFYEIIHDRGIGIVYIPMIDCVSVQDIEPYVKYIDVIINNTVYGHSLYLNAYGEKAHYIPYPVDTDYFAPDDFYEPTFDFLHNQGTGGSGYRKATDQVFIAFRQMHYQKPNATLLVNSQPYEHIHSQLFKDNENVTVRIKDIPSAVDIYHGAKVYVAPSRREGLGLPILEAMSMGLPVITTNAPPMNEWCPGNVLLVPTQDEQDLPYGDIPMYTPNPFELMQTMIYAYEHPNHMQRIGEQNRKIILNQFSWIVLKERYIKLIKSAIKKVSKECRPQIKSITP